MHQVKKQRKISYRSSDSLGKPIPCLPIQGKFLQLYNFSVGDRVVVSYSNGLINICKIINNQPDDDVATVAIR